MSDIDAIFAARPKKTIKTTPAVPSQPQRRRRARRHAKTDLKDARGSARRKTADGFNIYKADELGLSTTGGDTPLCPFDCQCCF